MCKKFIIVFLWPYSHAVACNLMLHNHVHFQSPVQGSVRSDFVLEVQVHAYSNPTHARVSPNKNEPNGVCCDNFALPPSCSDPCDNRFIFCLREFGRNDSNLGSQGCPYGREVTGHYDNNDDLTFTVGEEFPGGVLNPVIFSGTNWPVSSF